MQLALVILLVFGTADLFACAALLVFVWIEHRRIRREAAATGESIPSAAGEFGCLIALGIFGFIVLYGAAWFLFIDE